MIDDKKIEEAKDNIFNKYFLKNNEGMICVDHISEPIYLDYQIKQAIELGAKWIQEEFLKDLWHPASEKPKKFRKILYTGGSIDTTDTTMLIINNSWITKVYLLKIKKWCYIDDLFPKEGGEHD